MGAIQGAINSAIQSAGYLKKIKDIKNDNKYISNPNILKWRKTEQEYYKNQLKWASAANSAKQKLAEIKARHSLTDKADNMAKQKSDFKDLQLSIGGQKLDYNQLGENVRKQIDKEINDGK